MKKAFSTFAIIISIIAASVLMPFSRNVYAETLVSTSNIIGCNVYAIDILESGFNNKIECQLDNVYEGSAKFTFRFYVGSQSSASTGQQLIYVNGTSFRTTIGTAAASINQTKGLTVSSISSNNMHLVETPHVQNMWEFPFESYTFCYYNLTHNYDKYIGIDELNGYMFPIFNLMQDDIFFGAYLSTTQTQTMVFMINRNIYDSTTLLRFVHASGSTMAFVKRLSRFVIDNEQFSVIQVTVSNTTGSNGTINCLVDNNDTKIMPIYSQLTGYEYNSTEFALQFGLSNPYLDDVSNIENYVNTINTNISSINSKLTTTNNYLNTIANGTSGSNSSVSAADQANQDMNTAFNTFSTFEQQQDQNFNSALQNIDFSNPISGNSSLLSSASFIITAFNGIINNNPISLMIIIVCILVLGKRIIGK